MLNKKLLFSISLEILFTIALVFLLVFIREKAIRYLYDVQDLSGDINDIQTKLGEQNLTSYNQQEIQSTLDKVNSSLDKGIFLIKYILPISLILLSLVFYFFIWFVINKLNPLRFLYASIIPLILLILSVYLLFSYISYIFYYTDQSSLLLLIVSFLLLIVSYYYSLIILSNKEGFRKNLKLGFRNLKKLILPYLLNLLINLAYFILVFIVFFLTYVKEGYILPSIFLLIIIVLIGLERTYLIKRISIFK